MKRPLSQDEKQRIRDRIAPMVKTRDLLNRSIAEAEEELRIGTTWCSDPEEDRLYWAYLAYDREADERYHEAHEMKVYGRLVTEDERKGFAPYPSRLDGERFPQKDDWEEITREPRLSFEEWRSRERD